MTEKERELYNDRLKKLEALQKAKVDPYPAKAKRTHTVQKALSEFAKLETASKSIFLAGRIRALRGHGKLVFGDLEDASGSVQILFKADELEEKIFKLVEFLDVGDFISTSGTFFSTKAGEKTLQVKSFSLLTKSLRALPEKFHGLHDTETRLRKRYLDMLTNPKVREMIKKKNIFWQTIRSFLTKKGFLEVQTPVLENIPGGADAEPFKTHHNALDRDFYLRISLELPLKRLFVGGFEKVLEMGGLFRNEGIDREHLQEYDDVEFYWAYADLEKGMKLSREFFLEIIKEVLGEGSSVYQGNTIDWQQSWPVLDYFTEFKSRTGVDLDQNPSLEELRKVADKHSIAYETTFGTGRMIDATFKKLIRPTIIQPAFIVGHPAAISPLAKRDPKAPNKVLRMQIIAGGTELCNAFAELNDPVDQKKRFEEQMKLRESGDKEAQMLDQDFIEALEYGMPPAFGFGMSERFFAVLRNKPIRETVIFPPMREEI